MFVECEKNKTLKIAMVTALTLKTCPKGSFGRSSKIDNGLILREWGQQLTLTFFFIWKYLFTTLAKAKENEALSK